MHRGLRNTFVIGGLSGLVAVLSPVWFVHDRINRIRSRRRSGGSVAIPRVGADADLDDLFAAGRPTVVTGLLDAVEPAFSPTLDGLRSVADRHDERFKVVHHDRSAPYFLYVGEYGRSALGSSEHDLTSFLDWMFDGHDDVDQVSYKLFASRDVGGGIGDVLEAMAASLRSRTSLEPHVPVSGVWIGSAGAVTPLHHDAWPGILFQTHGTKRVTMYAPSDRANLYFEPPFKPTSRWSRLPGRSADADPAEFPRFRRAVRHETVLGPGDALVIPQYWSHEIEGLEANISVPFRFSARPLDRLNPGYLRPAVEVLHGKLTARRAA